MLHSKEIEVILAATPLGEIGYKNTIPWQLKGDLRNFKAITMGNIVIMGKNTWQSLSGPLEGRTVIVVSKSLASLVDQSHKTYNAFFVSSLEQAFHVCNSVQKNGQKIIIAGGVSLYTAAFMFPCIVHLTTVYKKPHKEYDTVIPNFNLNNFDLIHVPQFVYDTNPDTNLLEISHAYTTYRTKNYNALIGA